MFGSTSFGTSAFASSAPSSSSADGSTGVPVDPVVPVTPVDPVVPVSPTVPTTVGPSTPAIAPAVVPLDSTVAEVLAREKSTLPPWFSDSNPVLDALLTGLSAAWAWVFSFYLYAKMQSRIKTATDGWLDLIAGDFFGTRIARKANQSDTSFRSKIVSNLFRERTTRAALIQVLTELTGRAPIVVEPQRPADTGAYGGTDAITINGTPQIFRKDWQGTQLLYATPRTNLFKFSEFPNGVADANTRGGNVTASTMSGFAGALTLTNTGGVSSYAYKNVTLAASTQHALSAFVQMADGLPPAFGSSNATDSANDFVLVLGGTAIAPSTYRVDTLDGGRYRVSTVASSGVPTNSNSGVVKYASNSGRSVTVTGFDLKVEALSSYIPTNDAAVTITDYTLTSTGNLLLAQVPALGATLSWSGTFFSLRTGKTSTVSAQQFSKGDGFSTAFSMAPKYGFPGGYGVAGFYGSRLLPSQVFVIAFHPSNSGIPNIAGYGNPQGAYGTPPVSMYGSLSQIQDQVTDADILAAIDSVKPVGTVIWTTLKS